MVPLDTQLCEISAQIATALGQPEIAEFHYPNPRDAASLKGNFCAVRLTGGGSGLSYTLAEDAEIDRHSMHLPQPGDTAAQWVEVFSQPAKSIPGSQRAAALATINALYNALLRRTNTLLAPAPNSYGLSDVMSGDTVGMCWLLPSLGQATPQLGRESNCHRATP